MTRAAPTTALDSLEALQLVKRAGSDGARMYEITRVAPPRRAALERLLAVSDLREGLINVWRHLRRDRSPQGTDRSSHLWTPAR
jgi:hypothetical protein